MAEALQQGYVTPDTMIDTKGPLKWGRYRIHDFHNYGAKLSVTDVIRESSNIGAARIALKFGPKKQQAFLKSLGLFAPTPVELSEAPTVHPQLPQKWSDLSTMTIAYGHGIAVSPLHLATAYASLLNGGMRVYPTLLKTSHPKIGPRIVSQKVSAELRKMMRIVVKNGTASFGDVKGYQVGGKTGTADKPDPQGGYYHDKVISTFASVFPTSAPKYVLIVSLDEPQVHLGRDPERTAGFTAVPVAAAMIKQIGPLLGLRPTFDTATPKIDPAPKNTITVARN